MSTQSLRLRDRRDSLAGLIAVVTFVALCTGGWGQTSRSKQPAAPVPIKTLLIALRHDKTRAEAVGQLVMRGKTAVGPLVARVLPVPEDANVNNAMLWVLRVMGPDAVDKHAGDERMIAAGQVAGEVKPSAARDQVLGAWYRRRVQDAQPLRLNPRAGLLMVAAVKDE